MATKSRESYDGLQFDNTISPSLDDFDQDPVFGDILNLDDEPLFQDTWTNLQDTPPYDQGGLYSTPLSWEQPQVHDAVVQPKVETVQPPTQPPPQASDPTTMVTLTAAQQELLRSIAMPDHLQYPTAHDHSPRSATSTYKSGSVSSPDHDQHPRKRKSSSEEMDDDHSGDENAQRPVKKTAHNMIEKRYRTNLNDKIAALRDSVPSLRVMSKSARGEEGEKEDLQGLTPAHKLNKATVLAKATEYIRHLEKRTKRLAEDNASMKARIAAFEKLFLSGSMGMNPAPMPVQQFTFGGHEQYMSGNSAQMNGQVTPNISPRGMMEMSDDFRRMNQAQQMTQQTYQVPQETYQPMNRGQNGTNGWSNNGAYFGKMMVGSLAGLMILEGFSESHSTGDGSDPKGLFAIPTQLLGGVARYVQSSAEINVLGRHFSAAQTLSHLRLFLMIGALIYVFIPSIFSGLQKPKRTKTDVSTIGTAPSLAAPIQVRRQAWLTAIQTVWVPRHNFALEATALLLKMLKLSIRNLIGAYGYAVLTGTTEAQEGARVKAWSIALDAQLVGGDIDVSKSRLMLTLLASGTLPDTPLRLMLKALHVRVLLWDLGNGSFVGSHIFRKFALKLARWKWNEARQLQQLLSHVHVAQPAPDFEPLPEHLAALLANDSDDVLTDSIAQRAYNLAYNLPTTYNALDGSDAMDGIVDDHSIRSPLDAVAAWFSSRTLHKVLEESLQSKEKSTESIVSGVKLALATAPIGSSARVRALVARAVFVDEDRGRSITAAMLELEAVAPVVVVAEEKPAVGAAALNGTVPTLIMNPSTGSGSTLADLELAISCAKAVAHLKRPTNASHASALSIIRSVDPASRKLSLLGFASCYALLDTIITDDAARAECAESVEALAGALRIWIGGVEGERSGLARDVKAGVVERCIDVAKRCVGMDGEEDTGYESMSGMSEGC